MYFTRRGPFLKSLEEKIVVLCSIDSRHRDDSVTDTISFGDETFKLSEFRVVVPETDNLKIVIFRNNLAVNPDGILESQIDYIGNITPPNDKLSVADIVIRVEKNNQQLIIEGIEVVSGKQQLELNNREQTGNVNF